MHRPVTLQTLIVVVLAASLIAAAGGAAGGAALSQEVVKRGARGPVGPVGPEGPRGEAGDSGSVEPEEVYGAIEDDPDRVVRAIQDTLDVQAIQQQLDPDPADVESNLEDLCSSLSLSDALSNDVLTCP